MAKTLDITTAASSAARAHSSTMMTSPTTTATTLTMPLQQEQNGKLYRRRLVRKQSSESAVSRSTTTSSDDDDTSLLLVSPTPSVSNTTMSSINTTSISSSNSKSKSSSNSNSNRRSNGLKKSSSGSSSRRRRKQKKAHRDLLMGLIVHEISSTWEDNDNDDDDFEQQERRRQGKEQTTGILIDDSDTGGILPEEMYLSPADIFYATINGEEIRSSNSTVMSSSSHGVGSDEGQQEPFDSHPTAGLVGTTAHTTSTISTAKQLGCMDDCDYDFYDDADDAENDLTETCSFAGLAWEQYDDYTVPVTDDYNVPINDPTTTAALMFSPKSPRQSHQKQQVLQKDLLSPRSTNTNANTTTTTTTTNEGKNKKQKEEQQDDALSMSEIRELVMAQMPEEIKGKIPAEAWVRIFNDNKSLAASIDKTRKPPPLSKEILEAEEEDENNDNVDDNDDSSVISDITSYTNFTSAENDKSSSTTPTIPPVTTPKRPIYYAEEDETCPTLDISERMASLATTSTHSTASGSNTSRDVGDSIIDMSFRSTRSTSSSSNNKGSKNDCAVTQKHFNSHTELQGQQADQQSAQQQPRKNGVAFTTVQVRYYQRILDINPGVTSGVAIGIGWRYKRGGTTSVDDWEIQRGGVARQANELILPKHIREAMLKDLGYTSKDIATATRIINKAKHNRKATVLNLPNQAMEEAVESAARKVMGLLTFGKKKGLV